MGAWWMKVLSCLITVLAASVAAAQDTLPECEREETSLACVVAIELTRSISAYAEAIAAVGAPSGAALSPAMY